MKNLLLLFFIFLSTHTTAIANTTPQSSNDSLSCIYKLHDFDKNKNDVCIKNFLGEISNISDEKILYKFLGQMIAILNHFPEHKELLFSKAAPLPFQRIVLRSIMMSKTPEEGLSYSKRHNLSSDYQEFLAQEIVPLHQWPYSAGSAGNDILIGATMVSKDTLYANILYKNFQKMDIQKTADAIRMGYIMTKFGVETNKSAIYPENHKPNIVENLCNKYDCKNDVQTFLHLMNISTAFWALNSLTTQEQLFKASFDDFLKNNPDILKIIQKEQIYFSNYLTSLMLLSAFDKDKEKLKSFDNTLKKPMGQYENFQDVNPLMKKE